MPWENEVEDNTEGCHFWKIRRREKYRKSPIYNFEKKESGVLEKGSAGEMEAWIMKYTGPLDEWWTELMWGEASI